MNPKRIAILGGAICIALSTGLRIAPAEGVAPPDNAGGRYVFQKQAEGFVRLDTQTGAVSLCSPRAVGWACAAAPDERALFEQEIARLQAENAALKKDLVARGLPLPPGAGAVAAGATAATPDVRIAVQLPSDAELDRAVAYAGRLWHRFVDAVNRAQRQLLNKS